MAEEGRNVNMAEEANNVNMEEEASNVNMVEEANNVNMEEEANNVNMAEEANNVNMAEEANNVNMAEEAKVFVLRETLCHTDTVPALATSASNVVACSSFDGSVGFWVMDNGTFRKTFALSAHDGSVNAVAVAADGSVVASGGKDGAVSMWASKDGKKLCDFEIGSVVHALSFSPNQYWLSAATEDCVRVLDLDSMIIHDLKVTLYDHDNYYDNDYDINQDTYCTTLNWSVDGSTLFCGYTDGLVRVWEVISEASQ